MSMPLITIVAGLLLAVLGVGTFLGTGSSHYTALIPAGLGAAHFLLGLLGFRDHLRKHAMHAAALISLIGLLGGLGMGAPRWLQYFREGKITRANGSDASISALAMLGLALICAVHLALCVNSFLQAWRKARQEAAGKP